MSDEIKKRFAELPSRKADIEEHIRAKNAEMDGIHLANPRALEEYMQRKKQIEKLTNSYKDQQDSITTKRAMIDTKKVRFSLIQPYTRLFLVIQCWLWTNPLGGMNHAFLCLLQ